ncbi:sensor histidine kinase KdpD [Pseudomonas argentinensis]|uniref:histidine kinase n=1 Tax=Phytopseudomonas argentinensis TaxID=289370 RepID=A0A1I3GK22_9GAMM|nr:sensor histidine kinase KdpD [Pseudomonas argentinensis]KAB0549081.1 sensor histidine kinase KdpD [Pseudomonas argentinensis]SFI23789.1 two-component system, OmpR family, sensor histidine kinase KdpD [Pseudomonas argentinensis]
MQENREARADALAGELRRQNSGHLTLFLGAAPGVGKTYAMLSRARELRRQGVDLVIGVVETHGRSETAALLDGHELIPRRQIDYQGHRLDEMDLDAIVQRQPRIVLVDELAHRNAPGSRHERRWQDVLELLDKGIDVYSTVNIQHLESLNDIVHRITGIRVSETVPDAVLDRLRDIRLVDLPPGELIERLHQGKIYLPDMAEQALQRFFSAPNLAALRELAMQTAADHIEDHLREAHTAQGISGLALRRRVLIAIDGSGNSEYLVRAGRRLAERRDAPWSVVTVQRAGRIDPARQTELDRAFALARSLGADTQVLHGNNIADTLLDHAAHDGVSTLVVGRSRERPIARMFNRTLTQRLLQHGAHYELVILSSPHARAQSRAGWRHRAPARWLSCRDALYASLCASAATGFAWLAEQWVGLTDLSMIFIVAVVLVAARTRMSAAILAAILCFLAYNFFFIDPRYTLIIAAPWGITTVVLFLLTALVAGRLASQLRMQVLTLRAANTQASVLQHLGRQLSAAADLEQVLQAGRNTLERAFGATAMLQVGASQSSPSGLQLAQLDRAAADWAMSHGQPAGRHTQTLAGAAWWFLPLLGNDRVIGVVGLQENTQQRQLSAENRRLAEAICTDIAQAALRTTLVAELETARVSNETERLRSALLSSVSHDLRSPLAAMLGSAGSLISYSAAMSEEDRLSLLQTIQQEGERLDRYIQNLLDMTRLGHEGLTLHRSWIGVDELVGSATGRLRRYRPQVLVELQLDADLPPLWVHPALVEQSLFNVLENAAKFSPPGESIQVFAREVDGYLQLDVQDRGPGIAEEERERIFDMFYSIERGDCGKQGTGLGLTIAQGMIGAHGGSVSAFSGEGGQGTLIRLSIPLLEPDQSTEVRDDRD